MFDALPRALAMWAESACQAARGCPPLPEVHSAVPGPPGRPVSAATLTEPTESETAKVPVEKVVEEDTKPGQKNNNELESAGKKDTDDLLMPVGTKKKTNDAPTAEKNDDGGLLMPIGKKN